MTPKQKATFRWILGLGASAVVAGMVSGCSAGDNTSTLMPSSSVGSSSASLWGCDASGTRVKCTAAITDANENRPMAYACKAGQKAATCPDANALKNVPAVNALLAQADVATTFGNLTWACLVTGKQQYQCVKDLGAPSAGGYGSSSGGGAGKPGAPAHDCDGGYSEEGDAASPPGYGGGSSGGSSGGEGSSGGGYGPPTVPGSCDPSAWEGYFAQLATYQYNAHGVKVTFPVSIFHANAPLDTMGTAAAAEKHNAGMPSCHDGEWAMRDESWLDAVQHGCESLSDAITTMCQQAANYAPMAGACNATGTW